MAFFLFLLRWKSNAGSQIDTHRNIYENITYVVRQPQSTLNSMRKNARDKHLILTANGVLCVQFVFCILQKLKSWLLLLKARTHARLLFATRIHLYTCKSSFQCEYLILPYFAFNGDIVEYGWSQTWMSFSLLSFQFFFLHSSPFECEYEYEWGKYGWNFFSY